jgi:hypothetical protein
MNRILGLQRLANTNPVDVDSTQSVCCRGSTNSYRDCCN